MTRCCALMLILTPMASCDAMPQANFGLFTEELAHVKRFVPLSISETADLTERVQTKLVSVIAADADGKAPYSAGWIYPNSYEAILPVIRKALRDKEGLAAFEADLRLRQEFGRDFAVDSASRALAGACGLSQSQRAEIRKQLVEFYNAGRLRHHEGWETNTVEDLNWLIGKLELSDQQKRLWRANGVTVTSRPSSSEAVSSASDKNRATAIRAKLKPLLEARVLAVVGRLDLDSKLARKLEVASKGMVKRLVSIRVNAENEYQELLKTDPNPAYDSELSLNAIGGYPSLISRNGWHKFVKSCLTDEQWQQLEAQYEEDYEEVRRYYGASRTVSMCHRCDLNGKQQMAMRDLFSSLMKPRSMTRSSKMAYSTYKKMYAVPRSRYEELIGEENTVELLKVLQRFRIYFPNVEEDPDTVAELASGGE